MNNLQSRFEKVLRYVKAGRHFIIPTLILILIIVSYLVEATILLAEKTAVATRWAVDTLLIQYLDTDILPIEETDPDVPTKPVKPAKEFKTFTIRELKRLASIQKIAKYGHMTKTELLEVVNLPE